MVRSPAAPAGRCGPVCGAAYLVDFGDVFHLRVVEPVREVYVVVRDPRDAREMQEQSDSQIQARQGVQNAPE